MDNKQAAVDFLQLVIAGNIDQAYQTYVDMNGKHHNVYFSAGFATLRDAMKENHVKFPKKTFTIKNVFGEGDLIAVHSHLVMAAGDPGIAVVHMFRFQKGKIVEMWDVGQPIPEGLPNKDGPF